MTWDTCSITPASIKHLHLLNILGIEIGDNSFPSKVCSFLTLSKAKFSFIWSPGQCRLAARLSKGSVRILRHKTVMLHTDQPAFKLSSKISGEETHLFLWPVQRVFQEQTISTVYGCKWKQRDLWRNYVTQILTSLDKLGEGATGVWKCENETPAECMHDL